ncbi:MAG TPA: histone deacetylase [Kofleriaceae bacterium]|nr:histone deacetylase [Kofleriaceae bacterium]
MTRVSYVLDEVFFDHRPLGAHPERPERLMAIRDAVAPLLGGGHRLPIREADGAELARVHDPHYLAQLADTVAGNTGWLDADTYYSPGSHGAALAAAAAAIDVTLAAWRGDAALGLALVRPPGHHAESDRAMGFCLLNNVAIAARAVQAAGARRVAIFDWDVHHGNGTEHIFAADPDVLYLSIHQFPFYPGTGAPEDTGTGAGAGTTVNVGLEAGATDADYVAVMEQVIAPALSWFAPDIILVSAGFDAHAADPLAAMAVTGDGFAYLAARIRDLANGLCGGKVGCVLEGGYDLDGLADGVMRTVRQFIDDETPEGLDVEDEPMASTDAAIARTLHAHREAPWARRAA